MIKYNPKTKRYEQDGNPIEPAALVRLIHKLTDKMKGYAVDLTKRLKSGSITLREWRAQMMELLQNGHITAATIGRGGADRMTPKDWQKVENKVTWQGQYLKRFGKLTLAGALNDSVLERRAKSYADPVYTTYANAFQESQTEGKKEGVLARLITNSTEGCSECAADEAAGWMPIDEMGEIGSRICGDFCKCQIEFSDDDDGSSPDFTEAAVNLVFGVSE